MNSLPKISIVTPSYNHGDYLESTIQSVLNQDYPNMEYIIIDGGSTDNSVNIIRRYENKLTYWESCEDKGQSHAINKGFEKSSGEILCWINSDDLLNKNALKYAARQLIGGTSDAWLIGAAVLINHHGKKQGIRQPQNMFSEVMFLRWAGYWFAQQATFWTRALWEKAGPLDENLKYTMDLDLWMKMYEICQPRLTNEVLAAYRMHKQAKCVAFSPEARNERVAHLKSVLKTKWHNDRQSRGEKSFDRLIDDYVESNDELGRNIEALGRLKNHIVIGKILRLWAVLTGNRFEP